MKGKKKEVFEFQEIKIFKERKLYKIHIINSSIQKKKAVLEYYI